MKRNGGENKECGSRDGPPGDDRTGWCIVARDTLRAIAAATLFTMALRL